MLKEEHAQKLKEAGLYAYNHNLDSSESFYKTIITTRTYQDRLATLDVVENAGLSLCCGTIMGMGESLQDRLEFLHTLLMRKRPPDSIPINCLIAIPGTPLENQKKLSVWEVTRFIALTRLCFPKAIIRLSAGRLQRTLEEHALFFFAGANSLFAGEKLLTVENASYDFDSKMFDLFGFTKMESALCNR